MNERSGAGALLGPRVIGRLTPELVLRSPQYMNCVNQYELDLRENRITMIENLGTTEVCFSIVCSTGRPRLLGLNLRCLSLLQNQFDSIDMSDNAIVKLDGFPKLKRLTALHINNNRVMRLGPSLDGTGTHLRYDVEYQCKELSNL